ncbi:MAG: PA14 domain-containing protein, partial [Planctomycetota bacterium]
MSWRKTIYLMVFVLLLVLAAESVATNYYVATDGDDSDPGTIDQPWLSIKQSCYNLQPGDTLHIRGGTYTGSGNIDIDFKFNGKHGTQSTPIIIKAHPGEEVIIDAQQAANIFDLQNVDWMTIDSIEFRNGLHDHIFLGYDVAATNITIKNCKFSGIDFWAGNNPAAIYISTNASDITVNNNVMIGDGTDTAGCGVIMFRAGGEIKVFNNETYGTTNGIFVKHGNDPGCVTRIYNNYIHDVTGNGIFLNTDDGIVENNLIHDAGGAGVRIFEGMGYNGGDNNYISHNTIVNCGGGIYLQHPMDGDPGATNTQIYDNIIYYSSVASDNRTLTIWNYYSGAVGHNTVMNRNCYYDDNYTDELLIKTDTDYYADAYTLAGWQSFSCSSYSLGCQDADSIQQDPLFVNVGADDYHLQSGSPCKGAGTGGSDMGANVDFVGAVPLLDENAYYIDPVSGSDTTGDGSFGNPWKSFTNIQYYYSGPDYPPGWVQLQPGETIYLMDGVHNTLITSGGGYANMIAFFRFFNGNAENWFRIKAYPGHNPILDAGGTGRGITISSSSYWEVSGFELKNCTPRGIDLEGLNPGKIHDVHIHDVDGDSRNNVCALELNGCSNVEVYDCSFGDIIDTQCEINGTCWRGMMGIAIFASTSGADISVHDCDFYRTPSVDYTTGGIMYKHGSQIAGSYFDVYNNTFTELRTTSFQTGTANTHFHHNLIVDAATGLVKSQDFGGTTHQTNLTFEYNTFYNSAGFYLSPTTSWVNAEFPDDPTNINFNNNIIYSTDVEKIHLNQYMTDVLYYIMLDEYHSNYNCYYNPNLTPHEFRFASAWNEQPDYSEGGLYSYSQWQTNFGWDLNSTESDPLFVDAPNGDFHLQGGSPAAGMGMYPGTGPQPPGQASNPSPANSSTDVSVDADLSWNSGSGATSHDVYFGTDSTPDSGELQGNQTATTFDPGTMANSTTYYWRIDEVNAEGTTTGTVWSFTTEAAPQPPGQASNPSPANSSTDVSIDADLSWTAGSGATSRDVYFGTSSPGTFQGNQTATTFEPGTMANDTTYYWRIDEINAQGTTAGNVWSFTTVAAGAGTGLTGDYYDNMDFTSFVLTRVDATVNFNWGSGSPDPSIGADTFSVRWTGQVEPLYSETYTFYTTSDDGVRLWVDSQSLVDNWTDHSPTENSGTIALTAGVKYDIQMDYYENGGGAVAELRWSSASQAKEIIPQSQLFETAGPTPPGQASNPSPANSATDVSIDADLSWTAGADATSRDVYFGTSSPGAFQGNQTATTFEPGTLSYNVTYYWRIDEVNAGGTTTGVVWSFTTEAAPTPPGQATSPVPADSATDVSIAADLSWTAGTNSTSSDVYFGTSSPGTFQGNQTTTTFDPGTLDYDTTYYWRIDEINTGGTTTGNVWSFTTTSVPTYECDNWQSLHPEWIFCDDFESTDPMVGTGRYFEYDDDSGDFVVVDGIGVDNSRAMRVIWQTAETGAGNFKLGFGRNPSGYMDKGIRNTEDFRDVYYRFYLKMQDGWQGNPEKLSRTTVIAASDWSQAMIAHHWNGGAYNLALDPVSCVDASSQVVCIGYNDFANFEWLGNVGGTTPIFDSDNDDIWHYVEIHVKLNDPGQANGIQECWIDGVLDARADNLDFVTSYQDYAINAIFIENDWGVGSPQLQERYIDSFVVSTQPIGEWTPGPQPPGQASNPSPADSATDVAIDADLSWTAGTGSTSSDVYFGTTSPGTFQGNQTETTYDPGTMANDTTYYWRIDEINAEGTTTGNVWSFTTIVAAPGQASSPSPADSAADIAVDTDLSWTAGSGAASHDVYFGTSSPGTFQGNQAATTFDTGTMSNDTTYYWRIDEINAGGTTTGTVWSFTTIVAAPGQASSPSPADSATDIAVDTDLSWTTGSGATSHDVYFGTSSPGTFQGNQAATTFDTGTMSNDTTYYWRIDEVNASGTTTGSVWSFTTIVAAPGQASSPSPADSAADIAVDTDLSWSAGSG